MRIMNRRVFVGTLGALGTAAVLGGCAPENKSAVGETTGQEEMLSSSIEWSPTAANEDIVPKVAQSAPVIYAEAEVEQILNNPAVVTEAFVNADGSTTAPVYQMLRNRINRNGLGTGSMITKDHQFDLWVRLFTEEEAQAYIEMPMYKMFSAADFAKTSGRTEEECLEICNTIADKGLLRRLYIDDKPCFNTLGSEYGYYESYVQHFDKEFLELKELNKADDFGIGFLDSGTTMYRTLPVSLDAVVDENYTQWDDWRDIFKRNDTFAVSPCMCRSRHIITSEAAANVQEVLANDLRLECNHPMETCISTGEQAKYFIEIAAGREITAGEAVSIMENAINEGMVVETVYTKAAESICCCHSDCCGNLGAVRALNGGPALKNYSNFYLATQQENCIKCGACAAQCPMYSITMGDEGYPIVDGACVRCGQCATVCPQGARGLILNDEADLPYIPEDIIEDYEIKARDRISKGYTYDITSQSEMAAIVAEKTASA